LFSTHILSDVEEVADQFSVLHDGHIVFQWAAQAYQWNLEDAFLKHVGTLSSVR
jgi:ABC-type Na+ transport system ATPase subunit NatA